MKIILSNIFSEINISPNPTNDILRIDYKLNTKQSIQIELVDIMGNLIFSEHVPETISYSKTFNFIGLSTGIYLLKLKSIQNTIIKKVIKY
mgnify:CR=1 FL=1